MKRDEEVSNGQHGLLIGYKYRRGSLSTKGPQYKTKAGPGEVM